MDEQDSDGNKTNSEADTAAGKESLTNSEEQECIKMLNERYQNKIEDAQTFVEKLHNKKGPCPGAMMTACQDLKEQMKLAEEEDEQGFEITGYSDYLLLCLAQEKSLWRGC